jgi:hypothetical protein
MIVNNEVLKMWQEAVVAYVKALLRHPRQTGIDEKPCSGLSVLWSIDQPDVCRIRVKTELLEPAGWVYEVAYNLSPFCH